MNLESVEDIIPLVPVHFFAVQWDCPAILKDKLGKEHQLPDLSSFNGDKTFATVFLGWHEKGIWAQIELSAPFDQPRFPRFQEGDSVELFFDTRDVKTSGYTTRFCHHFYFLPSPLETENEEEGVQAAEVTRFRTEDAHELCDPRKLHVVTDEKWGRCRMKIFIPAECLHGYDPVMFNGLGFTYRVNRITGERQHFSAHSEDFSIEQQPSLWASLRLVG